MLTQAHVLPISEELRERLTLIHTGDVISIPLLLNSGDEENIVVRISAVDVSAHVVRIEGASTRESKRSKVIAQILRNTAPAAMSGYAEVTAYS